MTPLLPMDGTTDHSRTHPRLSAQTLSALRRPLQTSPPPPAALLRQPMPTPMAAAPIHNETAPSVVPPARPPAVASTSRCSPRQLHFRSPRHPNVQTVPNAPPARLPRRPPPAPSHPPTPGAPPIPNPPETIQAHPPNTAPVAWLSPPRYPQTSLLPPPNAEDSTHRASTKPGIPSPESIGSLRPCDGCPSPPTSPLPHPYPSRHPGLLPMSQVLNLNCSTVGFTNSSCPSTSNRIRPLAP